MVPQNGLTIKLQTTFVLIISSFNNTCTTQRSFLSGFRYAFMLLQIIFFRLFQVSTSDRLLYCFSSVRPQQCNSLSKYTPILRTKFRTLLRVSITLSKWILISSTFLKARAAIKLSFTVNVLKNLCYVRISKIASE